MSTAAMDSPSGDTGHERSFRHGNLETEDVSDWILKAARADETSEWNATIKYRGDTPEIPFPYKKHCPMVYFITGGEFVKIGTTTNISNRLDELQTGSPHDLRIAYTMSGSTDAERRMHHKFRDHHLRGEWFRNEGALSEFLAAAQRAE